MTAAAGVEAVLTRLLGGAVRLETLKDKPGRRRTSRAVGSAGTAIVKFYASGRALDVAARVAALQGGPSEPVLPRVLAVDAAMHVVALSEVPGAPLRLALLAGDADGCARAGAVLGSWHRAWWGRRPSPLRPHTAERELEILRARAASAGAALGAAVRHRAMSLAAPWQCPTVVHRDLYEEQILLGDRVGLIDLDDVALGPPELDIGNLVAHVELLGVRAGVPLTGPLRALLAAYRRCGPVLDRALAARCRRLALLRLACIHDAPELLQRLRGSIATFMGATVVG